MKEKNTKYVAWKNFEVCNWPKISKYLRWVPLQFPFFSTQKLAGETPEIWTRFWVCTPKGGAKKWHISFNVMPVVSIEYKISHDCINFFSNFWHKNDDRKGCYTTERQAAKKILYKIPPTPFMVEVQFWSPVYRGKLEDFLFVVDHVEALIVYNLRDIY